MAKQREQHRLLQRGEHSFLNEYRIERLESIGFVWSVRSSCSDDVDAYLLDAATDNAASMESEVASSASSKGGDGRGKSSVVQANPNTLPLA